MHHDAGERQQLCDLLIELGPEAPTLCEGWATLDMAAHLAMRERDPRGGLVIMGGERFSGLGERLMQKYRDRGFDVLVDRLRVGPPLFPWRVPGLRTALNLNEWYVHHEDVRRANGRGPRSLPEDLDQALWDGLRRAGRFMIRRSRGLGVEVTAPGRSPQRLRKGDAQVTISGPAPELVLYLNGRRDAAEVEVSGSEEALESLASAQLGI